MALTAKSQREFTSQLEVLLFKRDGIYAQVEDLYNIGLQVTIESPDLDLFKIRMERLDNQYASFNKCNLEIIKLKSMLDGELKAQVSADLKKISADMDTRYYFLMTTHKRLFPNETFHNTSASEEKYVPKSDSTVKLPRIELPIFDGSLKEWPAFRDCFVSLIHENKFLSDVHKFQYLLTSTKDDANALVRSLPLTDANYSIVWEKLLTRFDNKRVLASHYIDEILNFETLSHESPTKLRLLLDTLSDNLSAIDRINLPDNMSDFIIFHIVVKKLDKRTRLLFEEEYSTTEFPKLENLKVFLTNHCKAIEAAQNNEVKQPPKPISKLNPKYSSRPSNTAPQVRLGSTNHSKSLVSNTALSTSSCLYCNEAHAIHKCPVFCSLSPSQRKEYVRSKQCCFNCLGYHHMLSQCTSKFTCRKCNKRHHTLLHSDFKAPSNQDGVTLDKSSSPSSSDSKPTVFNDSKSQPDSSVSNTAAAVCHANRPIESKSITLLGTIQMKVQDSSGDFKFVRALADPGSQLSFITESCVQRLGLTRQKYCQPIVGLSQTPVNNTKGVVRCTLKPKYDGQNVIHANAVILDRITSHLPTCPIDTKVKQSFQHLNLADDNFDKPSPIEFLLGADLYTLVFDGGRLNSLPGLPTPFHTIFGWVLIGETSLDITSKRLGQNINTDLTCNLCISNPQTLDAQLKQFWEVETIPEKQNFVSEEDSFCENHFVTTHSRDPDTGKYIVKLPFRDIEPSLGDSYNSALNRLCSLERRLEKNEDLKASYHDFMDEYEKLGHMHCLTSSDENVKYYIPHHGIFKDSTSTKFRTVFDASALSSNGKSLNNLLYAGPKLQRDIGEIICNFRCHVVAFVADITKMYRQIWVHPDHRPFQTILWRSSPSLPVRTYCLKTVTYGVSSSPFLAMRTLHQLVQDESCKFPAAVRPIMEDMFVDDLICGSSSLEEALKVKNDVVGLLKAGGFDLRKWSSNSPEFLSTIPEGDRELKSIFTADDNAIKVLGIKWSPSKDVFSYEVKPVEAVPTKRNILSHIARVFDILGWIAPIVIYAKILIQRLWVLGLDWDELPSRNIQEEWLRFTDELTCLSEIEIPRFILSKNYKEICLHGFCDASMSAYAAVVYLQVIEEDGSSTTHLFLAKSRVAPLKTISLPKLELCGAFLLAKLLNYSKNLLSSRLNSLIKIFAWSDSTIVLNWIHTSPHLLKTFIANRVSLIQEVTNPVDWYHVVTDCNPADCASRGMYPKQLLDHSLWWNGPDWLGSQENWPSQNYAKVSITSLPEVKLNVLTSNTCFKTNLDNHNLTTFRFLRSETVIRWKNPNT